MLEPLGSVIMAVAAAATVSGTAWGAAHASGRTAGALLSGVVMSACMIDHAASLGLLPAHMWFVLLVATAIMASVGRLDASMRLHRAASSLVMAAVLMGVFGSSAHATAAPGALHHTSGGQAPLAIGLLVAYLVLTVVVLRRPRAAPPTRSSARWRAALEPCCMAAGTAAMIGAAALHPA